MSKYWNYGRAKAVALRNSPEPFHKVTHREIGDIPGCKYAPRETIFRPVTLEQAQAELSARADRWIKAIDDDQFGPSFRGDHFVEPLFGPYGEKL